MRQRRLLGERRANATMVSLQLAEPSLALGKIVPKGDFSQRLGISVGGDYYNWFL
ncbi:hypothetical protein L0B70_10915 [Kaistella sp. 97-N-M2]|uniref:hypothetical protein n=1 Tax=Kaistella sp. 97-N-M2 TaxID=2908645 RepID=UPI001F3F646C|nr:hypothetical protein [Kaistella sp. 97-N-M2]UJF29340.1 hypothetical protein L0B70_10915 [Kaistella sp. 97-N-M2]